MPSVSISSHFPDPALITHYSEHTDSFCTRASPWTKLGALLFLVVLVTVSTNPFLAVVLFALSVGIYSGAGLPLRHLFAWWTMPALFLFSLTGFLVFSGEGSQLFVVPGTGIAVTSAGLILCGTLLAKALAVVTASLVFVMTTRQALLAALASRLLPSPLDTLLLLAYRFLFTTAGVFLGQLCAAKSRGGDIIRQIPRHWRLWAALIGLTVLRSYERAERVTRAMESRGFTGRFPVQTTIPGPGPAGIALLLAGACLSGGVALWLP